MAVLELKKLSIRSKIFIVVSEFAVCSIFCIITLVCAKNLTNDVVVLYLP